jgi:hypothetical protein
MTPLLTELEAAPILGVSVHWLRKKRSQGGGPPYIKYGRAVRYETNALLAYRDAHRRGSLDPARPTSLADLPVHAPIRRGRLG